MRKSKKSSKKSASKKCPSGKILRRSYKRKVKGKTIKVSENCIRSVSQSKQKRSVRDKKIIEEKKKMHEKARKMFRASSKQKCPKGEILREGYYRKATSRKSYKRKDGTTVRAASIKGYWVPPTCAPSINREKGKQLFVLEKDVLGKYGYHDVKNLTVKERRTALSKALHDLEPLSLYRRLNALYILNKNQNPEIATRFKSDAEWIKSTGEYQRRPTAISVSSKRSSKKKRSRKSSKK